MEAHIVEAEAFVTCLMWLRIVSVCDVLMALRKPDAAPKPVGSAHIGHDVILVEMVHVLDDRDADDFLGGPEARSKSCKASASDRAVTPAPR